MDGENILIRDEPGGLRARAILPVLDDGDLRRRLGERGRATARAALQLGRRRPDDDRDLSARLRHAEAPRLAMEPGPLRCTSPATATLRPRPSARGRAPAASGVAATPDAATGTSLLVCVAGYILTAVGRVHQLFPVLGAASAGDPHRAARDRAVLARSGVEDGGRVMRRGPDDETSCSRCSSGWCSRMPGALVRRHQLRPGVRQSSSRPS